MKISNMITVTIATFLTTTALNAHAEGLQDIQARAKTRADEIMAAINADKQMKSTLVKSLEAAKSTYTRNGKAPSKEIAEADKVWMDYMKSYQAEKAGLSKDKVTEPAIVTKVLKDPCSAVLAKLKAKFSYIVEAFVSGPAGTNVCMIEPTSDFDQGDEAKWQKPWLEDMDVFVENPERDVSSKEFTIKTSRLIKNDAGQKIGVLHIATVVK